MNLNKFKVLEFDLKTMVENPAIVMIAKRGSGKSYITRDIIYYYRDIPGGVVIAPTDRMHPFFKFFFPDLYIHYNIDEIILKKILVRQTIMMQKRDAKKKMGLKVDSRAILIMDDCLSKKKTWQKSDSIIEILMNGRHYGLTYILTMQTPLGITPDLRLNFDYVFLLKDNSAINKKKLYDNYASMFPTVAYFEKVFAACTVDYKALVINNKSNSDEIKDNVFWFKAKPRKFTFGSSKFVRIHRRYYDKDCIMKKNAAIIGMNVLKKKNDINLRVEMKSL